MSTTPTNATTAPQVTPPRDVFSVICHDLRDPLAAIVMGTQLLLSTAQDDRSRRVLEAIGRAGDRMSLLIQNMGTLRGQPLELLERPHPTEELLNDVCAKLDRMAAAKSVRVERRFAVGDTLVLCDRARFVEALLVLGDNAIRHAGGRPVVVGATSDGNALTVSVTDRGAGIAKERLPTIFDWVFNASQASREGPGLGLAAARRIVECQGGTIDVVSRVGHGTTSTIVIPLHGAAVPATSNRLAEERPCSTS